MTLPCTTIGAAKVLNTAVPVVGVINVCLNRLGATPAKVRAPTDGVMTLPCTTIGAAKLLNTAVPDAG